MKIQVFTLILFFVAIHAVAQNPNYKSPTASYIPPESASLIDKIRYPVGYNTGKTDITIPLYEIEVAGVKVPISISFNHKGLKPGSLTRFIGQGWTLNADYSITTTINDRPDYNGNTNLLRAIDDPLMVTESGRADYKYQRNYSANYYDCYPDEYYYTLSGKNGMFMYRYQNGAYSPVVAPFEPIKINRQGKNYFVITDDNGCKYYFGNNTVDYLNNVEYTQSYTTGWKVGKIAFPDNRQAIEFDYNSYTYNNVMPNHFAVVEDISNGQDVRVLGPNDRYLYSPNSKYLPRITGSFDLVYPNGYQEYITGTEASSSYPLQRQYVSKVENVNFGESVYVKQINSITYDYGKVIFTRNGSGLIINITIKDKNNVTVKQVVFNHTAIDGYPILNSVIVYGKDTSIAKEKYVFDYHNFPTVFASLNFKNSTNFWGYYMSLSGRGNLHTTLVPTWRWNTPSVYFLNKSLFVVGYSDRELEAVTSGMLKSITNILGGKTEFVYESDHYKTVRYNDPFDLTSGFVVVNKKSGGLRIAEITDTDEAGDIIRKRTFKYGDNEDGLGMIRFPILPDSYMTERYTGDVSVKYSNGMVRERRFQSNLFGDNTFSGFPVAYTTVAEYVYSRDNGVLANVGKTIYDYYYPSDFVNIYKMQGSNVVLDPKNYWAFGHLKRKRDYKVDNNLYSIVQSTEYNYSEYYEIIPVNQMREKATFTNIYAYPYYEEHDLHEFNTESWELYVGGNRLISETVLSLGYSNTGIVKRYTYNNPKHNYPNEIVTSYAFDDEVIKKEKFLYALDNLTVSDADNNVAKARLVELNMVNTVLESRVEQGENTDQTFYYHKMFSGNFPRLSRVDVKNGASAAQTRVRYQNYDSFGNPIEVLVDEDKTYIYLWSYFGRFVVAEIRGATFAAVSNLLSTGYGNTPPANFESTLRSNLSGAHITFYDFDPFVGIKSITAPSGVKTNYYYNSAGQLTSVQDANNSSTLESYQYGRKNQ